MAVRNTKLSRKRKAQRKIRSRKLTGGRRKKSVCSKRLRKRTLSGGRKIRSARKRVRRSNKQIGGTSLDTHDERLRELEKINEIIGNVENGLIPIATFMAGTDEDYADLIYEEYRNMNIISETDFEGPERITILNNLVEYLGELHSKYKRAYDNITHCPSCKLMSRERFTRFTEQSITNQKIFEKTQQVLKISTDGLSPPSLSYKVRDNTSYPKVLKEPPAPDLPERAALKQPHLKGYHPEFTDITFLTELLKRWPRGTQIPQEL